MSDIEYRYKGLSYEALSRVASALLKVANESGNWHSILDDLIVIRTEMRLRLE